MLRKLTGSLAIAMLVCFIGCKSNNHGSPDVGPVGEATPTPTPPPTPMPEPSPLAYIKAFKEKAEARSDMSPGNPVLLCWDVERATRLEIQPELGIIEPLSLRDCGTVRPIKNEIYTLRALGEDGTTVEEKTSVAVTLLDPVIRHFIVKDKTIDFGKTATVCYRVDGAKKLTISGKGIAPFSPAKADQGCAMVPTSLFLDTTIVLEARNLNEKRAIASDTVSVKESAEAHVFDFGANATITRGSSARLCFTVSKGSMVQISNTGVSVLSKGQQVCGSVTPTVNTVYQLTATGPDQVPRLHPKSVSIIVNQPRPKGSFEPRFTSGGEPSLCYRLENLASAKITSGLPGPPPGNLSIDGKEHCFPVQKKLTDTYTLTALDLNNKPMPPITRKILVPDTRILQAGRQSGTERPFVRFKIAGCVKALLSYGGRPPQAIQCLASNNSYENLFVLPSNFPIGGDFVIQAFGSGNIKGDPVRVKMQ